ncbi:hypothetical protein Vafri_12949, partial [Volvox africanus]
IGSLFIGIIASLVLFGLGICAAFTFGILMIVVLVIGGYTSSLLSSQAVTNDADQTGEVLENKDDGVFAEHNISTELSSDFSIEEDDNITAGYELDKEDCSTHHHSGPSSSGPSGTCSSASLGGEDMLYIPSGISNSCQPCADGLYIYANNYGRDAGPSNPPARSMQLDSHDFLISEFYSQNQHEEVVLGKPPPPPPQQQQQQHFCQSERSYQYSNEVLDLEVMMSCDVVGQLGRGSFGQVDLVSLALPDGSTKLAVRKTLPCHNTHSYNLLRSMQAAAVSPYAVHYLGSCEYPADRIEVFMELAEGGTLEHELVDAIGLHPVVDPRVTRLLLPLQRIRVLAGSVLVALSKLHAVGVAHLGLEGPRHLLFNQHGRVLLNMSSAGRLGSRGHLGRLPKPPCCTAPEIVRRTASGTLPRVVAEADLYSLGVLMGICAFGYAQQQMGPDEGEQGRVRRWGEAGVGAGEVPEWVPEELRDFIVVLMAEDPRHRPSLEQALSHPFLQGLSADDMHL